MPGSSPDPPPRLAAGFVIVRRVRDRNGSTPRFLLLRAYRYWDFPKGEVADGETPLETALREAREETGLDELALRWGEAFTETEPYRGHGGLKVARYHLAESEEGDVDLPVSPELGRPEHHEARWASYREARELLGPRLRPILDWARERVAERPDPC